MLSLLANVLGLVKIAMQLSTVSTMHIPKVHLVSLGCSRNKVDAEVMLGSLIENGWEITQDETAADAIVVNTCGFIESAKEESVDTILEMSEHKKTKPSMRLVVTGCLSQRYKGQLASALPEVDFFVGVDEFAKLPGYLKDFSDNEKAETPVYAARTHYIYDEHLPRVNTLTRTSAYVKVAEGCEHNCAFCIIPAIRGKLRSRPIEKVRKEVEKLVAQGVVEINLIAQDLAAYGRDQVNGEDLLALLKDLVKVEGLRWIRMLYMYPENISDAFIDFIANEPKILPYLDIPIQHASNSVLERMGRDTSIEEIEKVLSKLRSKIPDMTIRTTLMVGFPGETEQDFAELEAFVSRQKLDHMGCFAYSVEAGTRAARMPDQIDDELKQARRARIMELQQEIVFAKNQSLVGKTFEAVIEKPSDESDLLIQARIYRQAPEVDGITYIQGGNVRMGEVQKVLINEAIGYDLAAEVVENLH
jgi:ribosomal protein S12 methylthiotransferase